MIVFDDSRNDAPPIAQGTPFEVARALLAHLTDDEVRELRALDPQPVRDERQRRRRNLLEAQRAILGLPPLKVTHHEPAADGDPWDLDTRFEATRTYVIPPRHLPAVRDEVKAWAENPDGTAS